MRPRTLLWFSGIWWLVPVQIIATHYILSANDFGRSGYPLATQIWVLEAQNLTLPLASVAAAIVGARIFRSGVLNRPLGRGVITVLLPIVGVLLIGTVLVNAGFQLVHIGWTNWVSFNFLLLVAPTLWALGAISLGFALAKTTPLPLAAPLALVAIYVALGFPGAFDTPWIRHVTPVILGCCDYRDQLDNRVILGAILSAIGLIGASAIIWVRIYGSHWIMALYSAAIFTPLLFASAAVVLELDYDAKKPREVGLECLDLGIEVCIWPEARDTALRAERQVREIGEIANKNGIDTPAKFVDQDAALLEVGAAEFVIWGDATPIDVQTSLVAAFMPQLSEECFEELESQRADAAIAAAFTAESRSMQWWGAQLGTTTDPDPDSVSTPLELNAARSAILTCDRTELDSLW